MVCDWCPLVRLRVIVSFLFGIQSEGGVVLDSLREEVYREVGRNLTPNLCLLQYVLGRNEGQRGSWSRRFQSKDTELRSYSTSKRKLLL